MDTSWREVGRRVDRIRAALDEAGLQPGDRVGILLPNCVDWIAFDVAAMANGLITVPLYLHEGPANSSYILAHSGVKLCIIDTMERWRSLAPSCGSCDMLETIWVRDAAGGTDPLSEPSVRAFGEVLPDDVETVREVACSGGDLATIIHTSGTTGRPKGVMLSHRALLWNADAVVKFVPPTPKDVFLSVLPLAHAFERTMGCVIPLVCGSRVVFSRSIAQLREDIALVRPTILIAVPRLYERIHEAVLKKTAGNPITGALTRRAAEIGWQLFEAERGRAPMPGGLTRNIIWPVLQRLVARKVIAAFGGRLRLAVSGGAPLSDAASHFLIGLGLPLIEGYGLTETAPVVTATTPEQSYPGSVGRALDGVELKTSENGELLIRSPAMMQGYWEEPEKTSETFDENGWFKTGDLAEIHDGNVFIKGRLKELIALSTGKKVAPTVVEAAIARNPVFDQVLVLGDGRPCLSVIVVLDRTHWAALATQNDIAPDDPNTPEAKRALIDLISDATTGLPGYSKVRAVHSVMEPWTTENGLLTPTLKTKRAAIERKFRNEIDDLYAGLTRSERHAPNTDGETPGAA